MIPESLLIAMILSLQAMNLMPIESLRGYWISKSRLRRKTIKVNLILSLSRRSWLPASVNLALSNPTSSSTPRPPTKSLRPSKKSWLRRSSPSSISGTWRIQTRIIWVMKRLSKQWRLRNFNNASLKRIGTFRPKPYLSFSTRSTK